MWFSTPLVVGSAASAAGGTIGATKIKGSNVAQSGSVTVPAGATSMTVKVQAPGGGGSLSHLSAVAYGGGAGGYSVTTIDVTGEDGETLAWTLGVAGKGSQVWTGPGTAGGNATVTNATLDDWASNISCTGGGGGTNYAAGAAGTATGGVTTNTNGGAGTQTAGGASGSDSTFSAPVGWPGKSGSGGGPGHYVPGEAFQYDGGDGGDGFIEFIFS